MSTNPATRLDDTDELDAALRRHLQHGAAPADDGFSLRVMAALPPQGPSPAQRRRARCVRWAQWTASTVAALGLAGLPWHAGPQAETGQWLAALSLLCMMVIWSVPSRWNRG